MEHYDLVVAGASFAGLACARAAASEGARVLVLEKQPFPGHTVRTTGLLVKEAAESLQVPVTLTRRIEGVRLYSPSLRYVDLSADGYYFLATDMPGLVTWLAAEAREAGVELRQGTAFADAQRVDGRFVMPELDASARFVVGADGPRSRVAERFGLSRNTDFLLGVEAEYRGVGLTADRLHCFLDSSLAPGYLGWAFAGVRGMTQVGLACSRPHKPPLADFIRRIGPLFDFDEAHIGHIRGGLIPVGGRVSRWHGDGVLLVGDAAGVVSPLTAGGIHTAIESGRAAGRALAQCARRNVPFEPSSVVHAYPRFFWKRRLRALLDRRPPDFLLEMAVAHPVARRVAELVYFHRRGLNSAAGWKALLRTPDRTDGRSAPPLGRLS
jgi:digeranylgeranylglycerophospholipid reductase